MTLARIVAVAALALVLGVLIGRAAAATPAQRTSAPAAGTADLVLYDDGLAAGWADWSWSSTVDVAVTGPVYSGTHALAFTATAGWAGLYLHRDTALNTDPYAALRFAARASAAGGRYAVSLYDGDDRQIDGGVPLADYGGDPVAGDWTVYRVPLADLGGAARRIKGIVIQERTGRAQPALYLDDLALAAAPGASPAAPTAMATVTPAPAPAPATRFLTLAPGAALRSGAECAALVRRSPWEPRPDNAAANHTPGISGVAIDGAGAALNARLAPRIDGDFTGTTDEIIQWGACKWGLDEDIVRAVAVQESSWRMSTLGDWDGRQYLSYGLLQVKRNVHAGTYPTSAASTAFNVDYALAWRRACYEGGFTWLNEVQPGAGYRAGDEWGCVGAWFSGRWYDAGANEYIAKVTAHLAERPWLRAGF